MVRRHYKLAKSIQKLKRKWSLKKINVTTLPLQEPSFDGAQSIYLKQNLGVLLGWWVKTYNLGFPRCENWIGNNGEGKL